MWMHHDLAWWGGTFARCIAIDAAGKFVGEFSDSNPEKLVGRAIGGLDEKKNNKTGRRAFRDGETLSGPIPSSDEHLVLRDIDSVAARTTTFSGDEKLQTGSQSLNHSRNLADRGYDCTVNLL
jgi:hypothetical protein